MIGFGLHFGERYDQTNAGPLIHVALSADPGGNRKRCALSADSKRGREGKRGSDQVPVGDGNNRKRTD